MSRQKRSEGDGGKFGRLFRGTVLLALVFSAGLITGQRLLNAGDEPTPLVALSSSRVAADPAKKPVKMTFSFYEHLSGEGEASGPAEQLPATSEPQPEPAVEAAPEGLAVPELVQDVLEKPNSGEGALYTIQVASHPSRAMATRELARLRALGLDAHMIAVESNEGKFYRVRVGKFATLDAVNARLNSLSSEGKVQGFVTPF